MGWSHSLENSSIEGVDAIMASIYGWYINGVYTDEDNCIWFWINTDFLDMLEWLAANPFY